MADTYDVVICGAGSGGGFLAGEIASRGTVLLLDAGPYIKGTPVFGVGAPERRKFSTQINLGQFIPDGIYTINRGVNSFQYPLYADESQQANLVVTREARVVGGGSFVNVGAWIRPRAVDWPDFANETGVVGWTKQAFEPHFQKAERILTVHRDARENWNKGSVLYEKTATDMGIPIFETASNRNNCIFCGQRNNAGVPCKYDSLMSTAITQIPKAEAAGAVVVDNATVLTIEMSGRKATGVTYVKDGKKVTVNARKLVVLSAGAIGTPLIFFNSQLHLVNRNVGKFLRAHPGVSVEAFMPGTEDWNSERGYQWNCYHYGMDEKGQPMDTLVYASASFPTTPWLAAQVGNYGKSYKDLMRRYRQRIGVWIFALKPDISGRVLGRAEGPVVKFPMVNADGFVEPKLFADVAAAVRQAAAVFTKMGAIFTVPNPNEPFGVFAQELALRLPAAGIFHSQSTCRAGASASNSVVDSNLMSHDVGNLMVCDASVIPNHISANTNAMVMAVASRAADFVNSQILSTGAGAGVSASRRVV